MNFLKKAASGLLAVCLSFSGASLSAGFENTADVNAAESVNMEWGTLEISGGGFVSGIVTGKKAMYARTDVGGAYRYNYDTQTWEQLLAFISEEDRGLLSVDAMCIDPNDDDTLYLLCGCAYFSGARTVIFKTTDGGKTFEEYDVTELIQVHGNGDGRHCGEAIAIDPDNPDVLYCGGDVSSSNTPLIWSQDGGKTWETVKGYSDLGFFSNTINWPTWDEHPVSCISDGAYNTQNGVASVKIYDGKVYVATSMTGKGNVVVADVGSDDFTVLSADLPTDVYPSRINQDADGNLLITYVAGLAFGNGSGGIYRYNVKDGTVDNISPVDNSFGACVSAPDDPNELIATTCAVWSSQSWDKSTTCWGEWLYRSSDGGKTWDSIYPGKMGAWAWNPDTQEMSQEQLYDFLNDGGCSWIYGKAIHWSGSLVVNPQDTSQIMVTSGNGVFKWDNIWTDKPTATFHAKGIEEVVALDMCSVPGGNTYSAIGDYDGFIHTAVDEPGIQYHPNIGSTCAIAYCPQNPDVMIRVSENEAKAYYSTDAGVTWNEMKVPNGGGKCAISQIDDDTYRFFKTSKDNASVQYSDDFGATWTECSGIKGSKTTFLVVEPDDPSTVYAYSAQYNAYWFYDTTKSEPTFEDAHYVFMVSNDYGATFTSQDVCKYDQCDIANRIGYLGKGEMVLGAGWYGAYHVTDGGKNIEKLDSVFYCKTIGYGAPEKEGGLNTLYMWGKPAETDPEGIYRSTDAGATWVAINTDKAYGGTGNGNFLVGDMNEFGTIYMSTVGAGIVYGRIAGDQPVEEVYGDADGNGKIDTNDVVKVMCYALDPDNYPLSAQGIKLADVYQHGDGITSSDAFSIQKRLVNLIDELPES